MLAVDTIARARRAHFVDNKSIWQVAGEFDLARNTVRRVLRLGGTAFAYAREVQPRPKLGAWTERLDLVRIFEDLQGEGVTGGHDTVRRHVQNRLRKRGTGPSDAYIPLGFDPGEAYQSDWSSEIVLIRGVTTSIQVAQVRLCHSRMPFVRAYPRQSQEMVFDAHDRAFAFYRGACQRSIYDNMRTAVDVLLIGRERQFNRRFAQMCSHYLVEPVGADAGASRQHKGMVLDAVLPRPFCNGGCGSRSKIPMPLGFPK